jgi:hypothetical protein
MPYGGGTKQIATKLRINQELKFIYMKKLNTKQMTTKHGMCAI